METGEGPATSSGGVRRRVPRLRCVLAPAALALLGAAPLAAAADPASKQFSSGIEDDRRVRHGPASGALVIGREDLLRVRSSLGRVSEELHLILGVLDQHLEAAPAPYGESATGADILRDLRRSAEGPMPRPTLEPARMPREPRRAEANASQGSGEDDVDETPTQEFVRISMAWFWFLGEWVAWFGIFGLDIGVIVGMQLFLESIGRKRGGSMIMPKKGVANALATKAAGGVGGPIPTPTATPGQGKRLSVLSQEEELAARLTENWPKLAVGMGLAMACRLPQHVLDNEGLACHMLINLTVMLRFMSLVMLLIRDDVALPARSSRDKAAQGPPAVPPQVASPNGSGGSRRRLGVGSRPFSDDIGEDLAAAAAAAKAAAAAAAAEVAAAAEPMSPAMRSDVL